MLVCQLSVVCLLLVPRSFHFPILGTGIFILTVCEMGDCVQHDRWWDTPARTVKEGAGGSVCSELDGDAPEPVC